jgi:hypothetical protein
VPTDRLKSTRSTRGALRSLTKTWWIWVRFSGVMLDEGAALVRRCTLATVPVVVASLFLGLAILIEPFFLGRLILNGLVVISAVFPTLVALAFLALILLCLASRWGPIRLGLARTIGLALTTFFGRVLAALRLSGAIVRCTRRGRLSCRLRCAARAREIVLKTASKGGGSGWNLISRG